MKRLKRHLVHIAIVAVVILGIRFARDVTDWVKLLQYEAPARVANLATTATMTDSARRLFYLNEPTIESRKSALNLCKSTEHTVVLGCYVPNKGIFLQEVSDPRLQGVMEVTAAHEMLHAAYQSMSILEQTQLNKQLQTTLQQLQNPRIAQLIETYREQDPSSVNNELHSILGTEVKTLSSELETYYRQYFTDRSAIVAMSERYEGVFTALREKAKTLNKQLAERKAVLEQLVARVKTESNNVESERSSLQSTISANPQSDYSSRVASFNNLVQNYNQLVSQLKEQTATYNQMVDEHNSLALEEKSLVESLQNKTSQQIAR